MSGIINIPFNFQPVQTGAVANGGYTVPAGRYARVVANLNTSALGTSVGGAYDSSGNSQGDSVVLELWLKSGDSLTVSNSPASAGGSNNASENGAMFSGSSVATLSLNGVVIAKSISAGSAGTSSGNSSTDGIMTIMGTSSVGIQFSEYNNIS